MSSESMDTKLDENLELESKADSAILPVVEDWSATPQTDASQSLDANGPLNSTEEDELLKSLDTIVQQASQGAGDFPSVTGSNPEFTTEPSAMGAELENIAGAAESIDVIAPTDGALAFDASIVGTPEEWTALATVSALDGDAVEALAQWLTVAKPAEREVYSRRIRLGYALMYALEQEPPPVGIRSILAQELGKTEASIQKLYPQKHVTISQHLAQSLGWSQSRLLKITIIAIMTFAVGGWVLAWRGFSQSQSLKAANHHSEKLLSEAVANRKVSEARLGFAASADLKIADLQSGEQRGHQTAHLLWSPFGRKALLWVRDFPVAPHGKEYVLWVLSGSRQFPAARFSEAPAEPGVFIDVPALQEGRPRPVEAFTLVLQPLQALDPADGIKLLSASAYY